MCYVQAGRLNYYDASNLAGGMGNEGKKACRTKQADEHVLEAIYAGSSCYFGSRDAPVTLFLGGMLVEGKVIT